MVPEGEVNMEALKPCPFCGYETLEVYDYALPGDPRPKWSVSCEMCMTLGPQKSTKSEAISAWNMRE